MANNVVNIKKAGAAHQLTRFFYVLRSQALRVFSAMAGV